MLLSPIVACYPCDSPKTDQYTEMGGRLPATADMGQQRQLHAVLEELIEERLQGCVLLSKAAFEYPSVDRARVDGGVGRGMIRLESSRLDHHTPPGGGSYYSWGSPVILREVVADHGDVVEVKGSSISPSPLGHGGKGADYLYELRTFLRKIDLVPVLKRPLVYRYVDGTSIKLFPGTAVGLPWSGDETQRAVSVEHLHFELPVPDDYLALSFTPKLRDDRHADAKPMLADGVRLVLNGESWASSSEIRDKELRTPIHHSTAGASRIFVALASTGIELKLIAETEGLVAEYKPQVEGARLTPIYDTPPRWFYRIPAGTGVYWSDGRRAGRTRRFIGKQSHVPPSVSMWCELYTEIMRTEPICFRVADIEVIDNQNRD